MLSLGTLFPVNTNFLFFLQNTDGIYLDKYYKMSVRYDQIISAELDALGDPGEKVLDGFDNDIVRTGTWHNDAWGEYSVNADPDTSNCVVLTLTDGRIFVFSIKDDDTTEEHYRTLLSYLSGN